MNVELPDGTVVQDIPDGISQRDLAVKLRANGMTVPDEWLGKQGKIKQRTEVQEVKEVGTVESALRTAGAAAKPVVKLLDMAAAGLAGVLGQKEEQERIFQDMELRQKTMGETYNPAQDEEFSQEGKLAGTVLSVPIGMVGQGAAPGIDRATEVIDRGGSLKEAAKAGATTGAVNQALQVVPMHAGAKVMGAVGGGTGRQLLAGAATGAAINVPAGMAGREIENAALPDRAEFKDLKRAWNDKEAVTTDAVMSAILGGVGARGAQKQRQKTAEAKAAEAPPSFPQDKFTDLGDGDYRAPNGATVTKEAWENSSPKIREGWMKEAPKEEKLPVGEAKEVGPEALTDTSSIDKLKELHPSGPVAEIAEQVRAEKLKKAAKAFEEQKARESAAELRQAAEKTDDVDLQTALRKRADALDPPPKIPVGEVKEGQPEIKVEEPKKIPVGEAKEVPLEPVVDNMPTKPLPVGEAKEITASGVEPTSEPKPGSIPAGEVKELYVPPEKAEVKAPELNSLAPNPSTEPKLVKDKTGQEYKVSVTDQMLGAAKDSRSILVEVRDPQTGARRGFVDFTVRPDGVLAAENVKVAPEFKRRGIAEILYRAARDAGFDIAPGRVQTQEGRLAAESLQRKGVINKEPLEAPRKAEDLQDIGLPKIDESFMAHEQRIQESKKPAASPEVQRRGVEQTRAAINKGVKDGTLDADGASLALWALEKNPNLASGTRTEVHPEWQGNGTIGSYNAGTRIIKIFKGNNKDTISHELGHAAEQLMPASIQRGIRREWRRALEAEIAKSSPEVAAALKLAVDASWGVEGSFAKVKKAFNDGILSAEKHYQFASPSEFWGVNWPRVLAEKRAARGSWRARARQWMREMVEHIKAIIGLRSDSAVLKAANELLNPEKTTGIRRGGADTLAEGEAQAKRSFNDDLLSISGPAKRELGDETKPELAERKLFDRFNRVAKLQKAEAPKSEDADIYQADQLYAGRVQHRGDVLERDFIKPLGKTLEAAKKAGVTVRDADDYLMALHAPERNAVIAKRNPKMQDGGSGLTNAQAKDIIDGFTPEQRKHLDAVAKIVHDLNSKKLDDMVDDGLISAQTRDTLKSQYKQYVPLKTLDAEEAFTGTGRGYEMRANDVTAAMGRGSKASSPIAASVMDASRALIRGEKARVDRTIWEYAQNKDAHDFVKPYDPDNPPPEVMDRKFDKDGKVTAVVSPQKVQDMTMSLVVNGENQRVFVPDQLLRDQLRKVGSTADPGPFLAAIGRGTATIGRLLTEFNPAFTLPNAVKDAITIGIRAGAHDGVSTAKVVAGIPSAWKAIADYKRGAKSADAQLYEEFMKTGGKTGAYGIQGVADTMRTLEKSGADLGYKEHSAGAVKKTVRTLGKVAQAVSSANEVLEYASRFSLYKEMRANGASPRKAASVAKEVTVNFNRSGEYSRVMNSLLVFANAALQGLRNTAVYGKSKHVQKGMLGLVALGAAVQAWNEQMGGENEETAEPNINSQNDAVADKNVVLLSPGSRSGAKVPLPPEYALPFTLGRRLYRGFSQGNWGKEAAGIAGATLDATLPVRIPEADSGALAVGKAVTPTLLSPFADIWTNQSYFGTPIVPEQHDKRAPAPYHTMSRTTTSDIAKAVSEIANSATGGDNIKPGMSQKALGPLVAPEGIEHLVKFYTGGVGALAMQSTNVAKAIAQDKPVDKNKIPVVNRFIFDEPQSYTSRRYKELAADFEYAKDYQKAGQDEKVTDPKVQAALPEYEAAEKELRMLFKQLRAASADSEEREAIQKEIKQVQSRVIKAYNEAVPK